MTIGNVLKKIFITAQAICYCTDYIPFHTAATIYYTSIVYIYAQGMRYTVLILLTCETVAKNKKKKQKQFYS